MIDEVANANRRLQNASPKVRREALADAHKRAKAIYDRYSSELKKATYDMKVARESIDQTHAPAEKFGKLGAYVETAPAPYRHIPELQGSLYLKEDIDFLMKNYARSDNFVVAAARSSKNVAGFLRSAQTTYDLGFLMIQGLGVLSVDFANVSRGRAPGQLWGRSMYRALRHAFNNEEAARWFASELKRYPEYAEEYIRFVRTAGLSEDLGPVGMLERAERNIGLKMGPAKIINHTFSNFLDSAAWNMWKSLRPLAKTEDDLEELGAFVRNILGKNSMEQLGMSEGQALIERAVLYAPSFTRAGLAIMAKAAFDPLSFGGRQALKSIAGLAGVLTTLVVAGNIMHQLYELNGDVTKLDWDDLGDELKQAFDPTAGAKFGTFRIGNVRYGLGGNLRTNLTLMGNLVRDGFDDPKNLRPWNPEDPRWINWNHPFTRFIRGKLHPSTATAMDIITGRDYIGHEMDSPREILNQIWRRPLPISIQNIIESDLGWKETVAIGGAEFMGARTTPVSKGDLFKEQVERDLGDSYDNIKRNEPDYLRLAQEDAENFPELAQKYDDWEADKQERGDKWQAVRDYVTKRRIDRDKELAQLASQIDWGVVGGAERYREEAKLIKAKYWDDYKNEAERQGIKLEDAPEDDRDASLHDQLRQIELDDYKTPEGDPDYDAYNADRDAIIKQMSTREQRAVKDKKYVFNTPGVGEIEKRKDEAAELWEPYKNAPKYKGLTVEQSGTVDALIKYVDYLRAQYELQTGKSAPARKKWFKKLLAQYQGTPAEQLLMYGYLSTFDTLRPSILDTTKRDLVMENPDFAVFYPSVFYDLSEEDQELWKQQWGGATGKAKGVAIDIDTVKPFDEEGGEGY